MQAIKGTIFFVFFIKRCKQKGTIFCIFDKKDASKNKIKQNNKKVKDWKWETPLVEIFFLPGNGARKLISGA
jgi:hypothetical protein